MQQRDASAQGYALPVTVLFVPMNRPPILAPSRRPMVALLPCSWLSLCSLPLSSSGPSCTGGTYQGGASIDWPVGDRVASLAIEGGIERSGSV
jgi:hypothetical protein